MSSLFCPNEEGRKTFVPVVYIVIDATADDAEQVSLSQGVAASISSCGIPIASWFGGRHWSYARRVGEGHRGGDPTIALLDIAVIPND